MDDHVPTAEFLALRERSLASLRATIAELVSAHPRFTLEIGSGHGHFLNGYAEAHPDQFCVGIDIVRDRLDRSERKRDRAKLTNLVFLRAEANDFVQLLPDGDTLSRIFVLFPDPWPKRRHHKNRLLNPDFATTLATKTSLGATLCFRTDHEPYFAEAQKVVRHHPQWKVSSEAVWPFELTTVFQSRAPTYYSWVALRQADPTPPKKH